MAVASISKFTTTGKLRYENDSFVSKFSLLSWIILNENRPGQNRFLKSRRLFQQRSFLWEGCWGVQYHMLNRSTTGSSNISFEDASSGQRWCQVHVLLYWGKEVEKWSWRALQLEKSFQLQDLSNFIFEFQMIEFFFRNRCREITKIVDSISG